MKYLNRHLVTVYATQELLDWVKTVKPELHRWTLGNINHSPAAFLIEEEDQNSHGMVLKNYFKEIVEHQLGSLYIEREHWPKGLTYDLFARWFTYQYHEEVCDLCGEEIERFDE